jgi:predicted nucleic acid-binding Zn ribbon protein
VSAELPPRLKDLLGGVGARLGLEDTRATGLLWARWSEIVGDAVAQNAEPTSLKKGVLRVRATSPTWAQELTYLATEIRTRANTLAGADVVREVRVWTGPGRVAGATQEGSRATQDGSDGSGGRTAPSDLPEAFERARRAWARRRVPRR